MAFCSAYRTSKAAVAALGESLRAEVAGLGIRVVEVRPGPIATDTLEVSDRPLEADTTGRARRPRADPAHRSWSHG